MYIGEMYYDSDDIDLFIEVSVKGDPEILADYNDNEKEYKKRVIATLIGGEIDKSIIDNFCDFLEELDEERWEVAKSERRE